MKIEFLTQDDPIYILPFFDEFFRQFAGEFDIVQLTSCRAMGKRPRLKLARELACLYRPSGMARLLGRSVTHRLLGSLPPKRGTSRFYSFRQLCAAFKVPYEKIANPNDPAYVRQVRRRAPDAIVSVACPYILRDEILGVPPLGCINIHHAPLPQYKGMMPTFWQMYHGETAVGVTVHRMTAKLDDGAALFRDQLTIEAGEPLDRLIRRSKRHGAHCMAQALHRLENGAEFLPARTDVPASSFTFPTFAEMREFHRRGLRSI